MNDEIGHSDITTPGDVIAELNRLMRVSQAGINALYVAEVKVAELDLAYERAYSLAILNAEGTAPEKTAMAKIEAGDSKLALDIGKAELNRIKAKLRAIESAQVAVSVIAKQVELQWRNA
jgi:serine/threonine protein kinase HipA of HipAB toxin-antitoxin module